jgi:hypothetical protein
MRYLLLGLITVGLVGCATPVQKKDMSAFTAAAPRSILVVPIVNKSLDVDAPLYVLTTLPIPLTNKGYYVFPVNTTKFILEQEGLYEGERIQLMPTPQLASMFGADAVLYVTINRWDAQYAFIATTVTVDFDYRIVSASGVEIWHENKKMVYQPQSSSSGSPIASLISAVVSAAITRAAPNYMPLAQSANKQVFQMGPNQLPDGPYATPAQIK